MSEPVRSEIGKEFPMSEPVRSQIGKEFPMSEPVNSDVLGVEDEDDGNAATVSCDETHEDQDVDDDEDEEFTEIYDFDKDEYVRVKVVVDDISLLDPADGKLFPNTCHVYCDQIKWLIKCYSEFEPVDRIRIRVFGPDPNYSEEPVYKNCGTIMTTTKIQVGQELNVLFLLSSCCPGLLRVGGADNDYIQPVTLKGKYVLLVCVFTPVIWADFESIYLCQLRTLSQQLSEAENFEMVIIPKMRKRCVTSKVTFDKLLSAFQGRLFVPFEFQDARDQICKYLNLRYLKSILVDPNCKVVQYLITDIVSNRYYPSPKNGTKLKYLSPDWITPSLKLRETREKYLSSSLAWLLDSTYGDHTLRLHNLSSGETTTVGQLNNKLVGLYLFRCGDKLKSLQKVYRQCGEKGLDFHIVVVCISFYIPGDPLEYQRVALGELQRFIPNTPWWVLPYNTATHATLDILTQIVDLDAVITVGPVRNFFVDVFGGEVIHCYGIQAYPFNREMVVRKYELAAKAITLDSMLTRGSVNYVVRGGKRVPVADLHDKVVVIYTDFELRYDRDRYKGLSKWYNEIRKQHSDFEVVFVSYFKPKQKNKSGMHSSPDIDLLERPFDAKHSKFFREHKSFFLGQNGHGFPKEGVMPESRLLFGKGGHLCSLDAVRRFENYGLDAYPYTSGCGDNYLRDDIMHSLASNFYSMGCYTGEKPYDVVSLDRRSARRK